MASAAYALYPHDVALAEVLKALGQSGFDKESICMMLAPKHPISTIVREANTRTFEPESSAVTAGLIGWLSQFGAVLIPTFGFFIRSREYFHSLLVEPASTNGNGNCGTLAGLGFRAEDTERFEQQLREDGVFVYVSTPGLSRTQWALELLRAAGANEAGLLENEKAAASAA